MKKTIQTIIGVGLALTLSLGVAPTALAYNGDEIPPEILAVSVPQQVIPGEKYSISVTVRDDPGYDEPGQIGTLSISATPNGIPNSPITTGKYVPPIYNPDGSQTQTWSFYAPDIPYGTYAGYSLWVSDMNGNDTVSTLAPIKVHDPAHPVDNAPKISGKLGVEHTLTGSIKSGAGSKTTYTWYGQYGYSTSGTQTKLIDRDYEKTVTLETRTVFPDGTQRLRSATSAPVGLGTLTPNAPKLGTPIMGKTIKADYQPGSSLFAWSGTVKTTVQWILDGKAISGATKDSYLPKPSDIGKKLQFRVNTTTNSRFYTQKPVVQLSPAKIVTSATLKAPKPQIRQMPSNEMYHYIGRTLRADVGNWSKGTSLSYQWTRDGKAIKGATKTSYTLVPADHKKRIGLTTTGKLLGHTTKSVSSATVKPILRTLSVERITTTGNHRAGKTIKVVRDKSGPAWTKGTTVNYQWYSNGKAIKGATKSSFKIRNADRGKTLRVKASGTKYGYTNGTASHSVKISKR